MTPEEKRIILAKACGWTQIKPDTVAGHPYGILPPLRGWIKLPDYFYDLNDIADAENTHCCKSNEKQWISNLSLVVHGKSPRKSTSNAMVRASASQRADALGLTLNLW